MPRTKYLNIDTRYYADKCLFAEYYLELPEHIRDVKSLSISTVELPVLLYTPFSEGSNEACSLYDEPVNHYSNVERRTIVDISNVEQGYITRYLYLEMIEYECGKHNNYLFSSSILGSQISKYIIAKIVLDYKNFPIGYMLPANLVNGFLITSARIYKKPIKLESMKIRLINEFGIPVFLEGLDFSFTIQLECDDVS